MQMKCAKMRELKETKISSERIEEKRKRLKNLNIFVFPV